MSPREAALAFVNEVRAERGIGPALTELPKGAHSGYDCPIANALGIHSEQDGYVGHGYVRFGQACVPDDSGYYSLSCEVAEFISNHDHRAYPDLLP